MAKARGGTGPGTIYLGQTLRFRLPVKIGDTIIHPVNDDDQFSLYFSFFFHQIDKGNSLWFKSIIFQIGNFSAHLFKELNQFY